MNFKIQFIKLKENSKRLKLSLYTVNTIIHKKLKAKAVKKTSVHRAIQAQKENRKRNSRNFYERYYSGNKYEYMITLDEVYVYLDHYNGARKIVYSQP